MHHFVSARSFAVLVALILLSTHAFHIVSLPSFTNHPDNGRKSAEKESTEGAYKYDVFLSFSGSDTRKNFTDHLYHRLINARPMQLRVFLANKSNRIGEEFPPQIFDAIAQSKISIPIISKNFASSKWCLLELIDMMDRRKNTSHIVLPIFYKVTASDVRHLKGSFGEAFHSQKKHFNEKVIQEGQQVLREVSYIQGWESENIFNGNEGELVKDVLKRVQSMLPQDFPLRIFGRKIIHREGPLGERSRLFATKEAFRVLMDKKGTERIEVIGPGHGQRHGQLQTYTSKHWRNMPSWSFMVYRFFNLL